MNQAEVNYISYDIINPETGEWLKRSIFCQFNNIEKVIDFAKELVNRKDIVIVDYSNKENPGWNKI